MPSSSDAAAGSRHPTSNASSYPPQSNVAVGIEVLHTIGEGVGDFRRRHDGSQGVSVADRFAQRDNIGNAPPASRIPRNASRRGRNPLKLRRRRKRRPPRERAGRLRGDSRRAGRSDRRSSTPTRRTRPQAGGPIRRVHATAPSASAVSVGPAAACLNFRASSSGYSHTEIQSSAITVPQATPGFPQ
jgi:hypothetical protein